MNIATPIVAPERAELESCIPAYRAEFRRKLAKDRAFRLTFPLMSTADVEAALRV